jgi:hypothetical protein
MGRVVWDDGRTESRHPAWVQERIIQEARTILRRLDIREVHALARARAR